MKEEEWKTAQKKAKVLFSQAVDVDLIMECETAHDMLKRLDDRFMKKSEAKQALIERKLSRLRYTEDNPNEFFTIFEALIRDLKNASATVDRK